MDKTIYDCQLLSPLYVNWRRRMTKCTRFQRKSDQVCNSMQSDKSRYCPHDVRVVEVRLCTKLPLMTPAPEVIKLFSYSTHLSMTFFLLINIKMPTIVGILIFISKKNVMLSSDLQEKSLNCWYLIFYRQNEFHSQLS